MKLEVRAVDSRGKVWLDKRYEGRAEVGVYLGREGTGDPFQEVYDRIAKDLLSKRQKLDEEHILTIDMTSRLRFAAELAPLAFSDYLEEKGGRYSVVRLPARDDPMMARVDGLRQRESVPAFAP